MRKTEKAPLETPIPVQGTRESFAGLSETVVSAKLRVYGLQLMEKVWGSEGSRGSCRGDEGCSLV